MSANDETRGGLAVIVWFMAAAMGAFALLAARKRIDRIALLTTNLAAEVGWLMERRGWPEELATLYLKHELNTLTTNTVNAIVRPQE